MRALQSVSTDIEDVFQYDPDNDFIVMKKSLPQQVPILNLGDIIDFATESYKVALVSNIILNFFLSASLQQIWSMINAQQLVVLLTLFNVKMPANASIFYVNLMAIASFDFYEMGEFYDDILSLEPTAPYNENFELIGFGSLYFLNNLGTMSISFIAYAIWVCIILILYLFRKTWRRLRTLTRSSRHAMFFGTLITILNESYSVLSVCILLNIGYLSFDSFGQRV